MKDYVLIRSEAYANIEQMFARIRELAEQGYEVQQMVNHAQQQTWFLLSKTITPLSVQRPEGERRLEPTL